jgi:hypothetical protein
MDFCQPDALSRLITSHSTQDEEVVVTTLQAEFHMDGLIIHSPVTFDKPRSITAKDVLVQSVKKFIKSRRPDLTRLRQHTDWPQTPRFLPKLRGPPIEQACVLHRERVVIRNALGTKVS